MVLVKRARLRQTHDANIEIHSAAPLFVESKIGKIMRVVRLELTTSGL